MNNLYWRGVRSFLLVAKAGSFTKAANDSGISKANLSQQVTELEKHLAVQLLFRTTRKLRLTEAGELYYQQCQQAVAQLENASEIATQQSQSIKGLIKVNTVGGIIGEQLIVPLLIEFQQRYADVEFDIDFSSRQEDLLSTPFDLVIRMGELADSSLIARKLHTITSCFAASPEFLSRYPAITQPQDLKQLPWVYGSVAEWRFEKNTAHNNNDQHKDASQVISAERGFKAANGQAMLQACIAGLGVTRIGDVYLTPYLASGQLVEVLNDWRQVTPLWLVCPPHKYQLMRVKLLMDFLVDNFAAKLAEL